MYRIYVKKNSFDCSYLFLLFFSLISNIYANTLGRVQEQVGDKMAGHTDIEFHPAKILAVMLIVRQARCLLFRENLLKKLREQQGRPSSMPSTPVRSQQDTDNSKKSERGNDINNV